MLKKYTTPRPVLTTYVQWDGTNIAEFEELTGEDWPYLWWNSVTFVDNDGDLEIWHAVHNHLVETIPAGYWCAGPGVVTDVVTGSQFEQVIEGTKPFNYSIDTP